jgi:hypothetical protein
MSWAVANARGAKGNAIIIAKQASGSAKIGPLMATFNAIALMSTNPWSMRPSTFVIYPCPRRGSHDDRCSHGVETDLFSRSIASSSSSSDRVEIPSARNPGSFSEAVVSICISST